MIARTPAKMQAAGLKQAEIYAHPAFSPEKIVADLMAMSPEYGGSSIIHKLKKIIAIRRLERSQSRVQFNELDLGTNGMLLVR